MTKQSQIESLKTQLRTAQELKQLALGNYNLATRLETEATSALEELGVQKERAPKGSMLSEKMKQSLLASLTK